MKQLFLLVVVVVSIAATVSAQEKFTLNEGSIEQETYYLSMPYELINGKMFVEVSIHNQPHRFLFDTGMPASVTKKLSQALNLPSLQQVKGTDQSGKSENLDIAVLPTLSLQGINFLNTPVLIVDQPLIFDCLEIDGVIGSNLLRNSIVQISSIQKTIVITNQEDKLALDLGQASELLLTANQSSPYIWVTLMGNQKSGKEQLLFDTGMNEFYDLSLNTYKKFRSLKVFEQLAKSEGSNSMGLFGVADDAQHLRLNLPEMNICGTSFRNISLSTTTDDHSRIGTELLDHGLVTIDYKNRRFYFSPFQASEIDLSSTQWPVDFTLAQDKLVIGIVWDKSLKELSTGDQVLSVDEIDYENFDPCRLIREGLVFKKRERINLKVKNKRGEVKEVSLER